MYDNVYKEHVMLLQKDFTYSFSVELVKDIVYFLQNILNISNLNSINFTCLKKRMN